MFLASFHEPLELRSALGATDLGDGLAVTDPDAIERHVRLLLEDPSNRYRLLRALEDDALELAFPPDDHQLCLLVTRRLSMGTLVLVRRRELSREIARLDSPPAQNGERQAATEEKPPEAKPKEAEAKVRDWKIECKHHAAGSRPFFERGALIQVVPDKGKTKESVTVHWRDDYLGSMPPSLPLTTSGHPEAKASQSGASAGYTAYKGEVAYLGELNELRFPFPPFWRALNEKTSYTFGAGPRPVSVEVYNPRQFKLELKFPPLESFKAGYKYTASSQSIEGDSLSKLSMTKKKTVKEKLEVSAEGWKPSTLKIASSSSTHTTTTTGGKTTRKHEPESETSTKLADAIVLSRDGGALSIDAAKVVGSLLEFIKEGLGIIKTIKSYAPQVGWYVDLEIQVMQGGLAAEWYWQEWQDHRVFRYIDVKAALDIFSITFEIGVGVSAYSFKLQVFGQVSGSLGVEVSGTRYKPDGAPGAALQGKGSIGGALGARAEAGYFFKFNAKMETALEVDLTLGINQPNRSQIVSIDGGFVWTGIECTATGSIGMWGIGGTKKWKGTLVPKSERLHVEWPSPKEYKPPFMSRDAIKAVLAKVLSNSWDIRVFTPSGSAFVADKAWTVDEIAGALAARIERDRAFHRTPEMVDALANAVRQDLDALGDRWGRDWIEADRFKAYLDGAIDGRSLQKHLDDGASPLRKLAG
ncbi:MULTISPECIES: hypothetical protein [Sorangium]|uniref:Uncharacterized protein n=1 Tax=Sorangium cellulosum TaxID=56 RepID=A0A4V0NGU4_SORCE|nr:MULTISPECIES: hypothetical protein [Sorangium]AUX34382.1 uncharacterized protein SOCE836_065550 [Sorangium cellulosum]WCQ93698.1 hypothetical protein NQZ70_06451 [Sorangium sp. Soce836]